MIPSYIYVRPDGFYLHRPFDGGMEIGTSKSPNSRISRQTRKYFSYQSGKGIKTSLAITFSPQVPIINLTYQATGVNVSQVASMSSGSTTMTVTDSSSFVVGMIVEGTDIPAGTRIESITDGTTIELTLACTGAIASGTVDFKKKVLATATCTKPVSYTHLTLPTNREV